MIPAPLRSPLGLDENGVITSPVWRIFFAQQLINADQTPDVEIIALDQLLSKGQPTAPDPSEALSIPAQHPRQAQLAGEFPPLTPRAAPFDDLAMAAASQFGRQQIPWIISDTKANRANYPNSVYPPDTLFVATDWLVTWRNTGAVWKYDCGVYRDTLANIPTLGTDDAGLRFAVSDYKHELRWAGAAWDFSDGDPGSGFIVEGKPDGSAPNGGLWGLADGSTYAVLKGDGTTQNIVTVNRTNDSFPEGSTTFGAKAAARAKWEATAVTDDESAHIHSVDPPSTLSGNDTGGTSFNYTAGVVPSGSVATHTHVHDVDIAPFNSGVGSAHHHTLSDASAQLKVFSEANGGLPARVGVSYFIRR